MTIGPSYEVRLESLKKRAKERNYTKEQFDKYLKYIEEAVELEEKEYWMKTPEEFKKWMVYNE